MSFIIHHQTKNPLVDKHKLFYNNLVLKNSALVCLCTFITNYIVKSIQVVIFLTCKVSDPSFKSSNVLSDCWLLVYVI